MKRSITNLWRTNWKNTVVLQFWNCIKEDGGEYCTVQKVDCGWWKVRDCEHPRTLPLRQNGPPSPHSSDAHRLQMAPNLKPAKRILIRDMIKDGGFKNEEIAEAASCTDRTVKAIDRNLRLFGSTTAPPNRGGRPRSITPAMLHSLLEHLGPEPDLYLEEMVEYFWSEFRVRITKSSVSRTLRSVGWSKKNIRRVAKERNAELRNFYLYKLSSFHSYQVVYVDESGCDTRAGFRRTGWSPRGTTPIQIADFHRGQRYQILPAYTQDGILLSRVFQGSTDSAVFEGFIEQLLHHCGLAVPWSQRVWTGKTAHNENVWSEWTPGVPFWLSATSTDVCKTGFTRVHKILKCQSPTRTPLQSFKQHHRPDLIIKVNQSCSPVFIFKQYRYISLPTNARECGTPIVNSGIELLSYSTSYLYCKMSLRLQRNLHL